MKFRKVTAIVQPGVLEKVEKSLQDIGVRGISVTKVKGYGEYANFYSRDWMISVSHVTIEISTEKAKVKAIVNAILEAAHLGLEGDDIVAVLPVEQVFRIRTKSVATAGEV
jgi:nitrogen regulatory protein P-II 1